MFKQLLGILLSLVIMTSVGLAEIISNLDILKKELAFLNLSNPEKDLDKNIADGDQRFIAIHGYTYMFPGVEKDAVVKLYGFRPIEGTSDVIESEEHGQLMNLAKTYAAKYNKALLEKLNIISEHSQPWSNKFPYPYTEDDAELVKESYKEKWTKSSADDWIGAVRRAKQALEEWGPILSKYEYKDKQYDMISVSESPNFISVIFYPVGFEKLPSVEIRMTKKEFTVLSILPGS